MMASDDKTTTFRIDPILREVLDKIVASDPRYNNRSDLIRNWIWEKITSLGYFDEAKVVQAAKAGAN